MTGMGAGLTWGSALINGRTGGLRDEDRLHVPGARTRPAWDVTSPEPSRRRWPCTTGERGGRTRPEGDLLPRPGREPARHEGAAAGARRQPRDQRGDPGAGSCPTSSSGTPSGSSRRSARPSRSTRRMRSCASEDRDGRSRRGAPRLDGRDPRPRRRGGRGPLSKDRERLAGELQLPGPDRRLGRGRRRGRGVHRGRGGGRPQGGPAPRFRHSTRRSSSGRPTSCARRSADSLRRPAPRSCRP